MRGIQEILQKYKENMDRQRELDEQLLVNQSKEKWIACLQNRAVENQRMYGENTQLIQELEELLTQPLDETGAQVMYEEARAMYLEAYDDCQVLLPMLYKLAEYYEQRTETDKEALEKLVFLYGAIYYETNEVQNRWEGKQELDETYNYKILAYRDSYFDFPTVEGRRRIWGTYYNLIVSGVVNKAISADESFEYYKEALEFWNRPKVQKLDGENEEIKELVERIRREWLMVEEFVEESSEETKAAFCRVAEEAYTKEMQEKDSVFEVNNEVYASYLHARVLLGKSTMDESVDAYFEYYNERIKNLSELKEIADEDFYFIINTPLTIEGWLKYGISEEKRKSVKEILKQMTQESWYQMLGKYASPFLNGLMAEWCFKLMKYMDCQEEKEDWLFQLLVRRQLPTYLHSVMVMYLAEALCKEAMRARPELFTEIENVQREELVGFVKQCALLHDVGKTKITDIVNTQGRKLWDREFLGIQKHPGYGAEMLDTDADLTKYRDVALGHHRFYDGTGGYPKDFDNVSSPYRVIIDLITICDCIDAATDHLGRNYKVAKTLDMVLEELVAGKGTRYNPDLVEVIENSSGLKKEMRYIVSEGRLDIMYRAYFESVI